MSQEIILLIILIISGFIFLIFLFNKKLSSLTEKSKPDEALTEWLKSMQNSLDQTQKTLNQTLRQTDKNIVDTLQQSTRAMNVRLDKAAEVIGQVGKEVGQMAEIGRSMKDLQEFLRSPKLRGNIGEQVLRDLLAQMMPKQSFHLQYVFKSGAMVDAAIKTDAGIIPIDSKFPLENFKLMMSAKAEKEKEKAKKTFINDVRKHIRDIAGKYILTEEGTLDYALMYIPSEPVYYEIMANSPELAEYAHQHRVLPVSPSTFYAYLRAILMSFEGKKIEQRAGEILLAIRAMRQDYEKVESGLSVLGKHLTNAYNQMHNVFSGFTLLGQKLSSTQRLGSGVKEEIKQVKMKSV